MKLRLGLLALILLAAPATASETCISIARALLTADPAFPQIVEATAAEIDAWPQSCAATPPTGDGRIEALCVAQTATTPIYFWAKQGKTTRTLGYEACTGS